MKILKSFIFFTFLFSVVQTWCMLEALKGTCLTADTLDELIIQGIEHIKKNGKSFSARAGSGQQAYHVTYMLENPLNRVHNLRKPTSIRYFCRELLAYFKGSMNVNDGLAHASKFWKTLADSNNEINSNYGYYIFHQKVAECENKTQYEWCLANLKKNIDSRKALVNINQPYHKNFKTKDFPCTISLQFFVLEDHLCCTVASRSTDVYTGLPYDMGFFAFVAELLYRDLKAELPKEKALKLKLGPVSMKTMFTQIYDKTRSKALEILESKQERNDTIKMPEIENAKLVLKDIYNQTDKTKVIQWIKENAK